MMERVIESAKLWAFSSDWTVHKERHNTSLSRIHIACLILTVCHVCSFCHVLCSCLVFSLAMSPLFSSVSLLPCHQLHLRHLCFSPQLPSLTNHPPQYLDSRFSHVHCRHSCQEHAIHVCIRVVHVVLVIVRFFLSVFGIPAQLRFCLDFVINQVLIWKICIRVLPSPPRHTPPL